MSALEGLILSASGNSFQDKAGPWEGRYLATSQRRCVEADGVGGEAEGLGPASGCAFSLALMAQIPPSGPPSHLSTRPRFQELRRETGGGLR